MRADARLQEILSLMVKAPNTNWNGAQQAYFITGPDGVDRQFSIAGHQEDMAFYEKTGQYVNGLSNPENWNWGRLNRWVNKAVENGFTVTVMTFQIPQWLNTTAGSAGAPEDWNIYRDIISKVYLHLRDRIDYYEFLNEPHRSVNEGGNILRPNGSAYTGGKNQIVSDTLYQSIDAIYEAERALTGNPDVRPNVKLGGGAMMYGMQDAVYSIASSPLNTSPGLIAWILFPFINIVLVQLQPIPRIALQRTAETLSNGYVKKPVAKLRSF